MQIEFRTTGHYRKMDAKIGNGRTRHDLGHYEEEKVSRNSAQERLEVSRFESFGRNGDAQRTLQREIGLKSLMCEAWEDLGIKAMAVALTPLGSVPESASGRDGATSFFRFKSATIEVSHDDPRLVKRRRRSAKMFPQNWSILVALWFEVRRPTLKNKRCSMESKNPEGNIFSSLHGMKGSRVERKDLASLGWAFLFQHSLYLCALYSEIPNRSLVLLCGSRVPCKAEAPPSSLPIRERQKHTEVPFLPSLSLTSTSRPDLPCRLLPLVRIQTKVGVQRQSLHLWFLKTNNPIPLLSCSNPARPLPPTTSALAEYRWSCLYS
ncbi:hypothetical protein KFK09_006943 [Dendrobium nobile]|uniref:Uncharacterized protein n=1 Tax=Dendrobium nobile TaxID=94219 RepID=A0A8T3BVS2_DENNO|nr:hypothetical protein KFK09_006943 [Dendrobium nobile]